MAYRKKKSDPESAERMAVKEQVHVSDMVRVDAFYPETLTVDVTILSQKEIDASYESQRPVVNVPCSVFQFGRFIIRPWYREGDVGLLLYNDTDTDMAMADGSEGEPNTRRNHAPEDAKFIGGIKTDSAVIPGGIPDECFVICNEAGDVFWSIQDDKMQSKGLIEHEGDIHIKGNIELIGNIKQEGNYEQTGTHTVHDGDVIADGISLKTHTHPGTGPPVGGD